jgi:hypothetical protein
MTTRFASVCPGDASSFPSIYRQLTVVHLRDARWDLPQVSLVGPRAGAVLCPLKTLDKSTDPDGQRRPLAPATSTALLPPSAGIAPLLRQFLADQAATGLAPAWLPSDDHEPNCWLPGTYTASRVLISQPAE